MTKFIENSLSRLDFAVWTLVIVFFTVSAVLFSGDLNSAFIVVMALISFSIEIIIEGLKDVKGIGTITGFITNGPELLCLVVGLVMGDMLFAASTPLGSNFMNPVLLFIAAALTSHVVGVIKVAPIKLAVAITSTASLAIGFYLIPQTALFFGVWAVGALVISIYLFFTRIDDDSSQNEEELTISKKWLVPAMLILLVSGYFLDPVVSFAAGASNAPKGIIGFFVLATLTSWPEFKATLGFLKRGRRRSAILNIVVSNVTNLWLAIAGVVVYLLS